jgi:hypothetical protein
MKALKSFCLTLLVLLSIGAWAMPVKALELFSNFNDGTELGNRPYGIPDMAPVRYHSGQPAPGETWWQHHHQDNCRSCGDGPEYSSAPAEYSNEQRDGSDQSNDQVAHEQSSSGPIRIHAAAMGAEKLTPAGDEDWRRGESFLPTDSESEADSAE